MKLEPHDSDFLSPIQLSVAYDPMAKCPEWERFIADTLPQDCSHIPAQMLAWLMVPNTNNKKTLLFQGEGNNGKGILLNGITQALGKTNISNISFQALEENTFAASSLVGKLANFCGDLGTEILKESQNFKKVTGQDPNQVERKGQQSFEVELFSRFVGACNPLPKSKDTSDGWFNRWWIVRMPKQFTSDPLKDRQLRFDMTTPEELSGLFNKALAEFKEVMLRGITESPSMLEMSDKLRSNSGKFSSRIEEYLDEHYVAYDGASVGLRNMYKHFKKTVTLSADVKEGVFKQVVVGMWGLPVKGNRGLVWRGRHCPTSDFEGFLQ